MKYRLMNWLICPHCKSENLILESTKTVKTNVYSSHILDGDLEDDWEHEVIEGAIHCSDCETYYPIRDGIPRMVIGELGPQTQHRTTSFDRAIDVWEEHFKELSYPLTEKDYLGKTVVDIGCGYGRHSFFAARYGAEVIAVDSSEDAVLSTSKNCASLKHVHVVMADAAQLPIKSQVIDHAYCFGVLHHIENPLEVMKKATDILKPSGSLSLWVYGPRQGLTLMINNALRGMTTNMSHEELLRFSRTIASSLRLFSHTPYKIFGQIPGLRSIVSHLPVHDHHKWPFDVVVADIYDRLRIPVLHWFTREDLEKWYGNMGYVNFSVRRRVGNNETFCATGFRR